MSAASAQGLFNLLILGVGMVVASFLFPALKAKWTIAVSRRAAPRSTTTSSSSSRPVWRWWRSSFSLFFFKPPTERPEPAQVEVEATPAPH